MGKLSDAGNSLQMLCPSAPDFQSFSCWNFNTIRFFFFFSTEEETHANELRKGHHLSLQFEGVKALVNCVSVETSFSCAGLISDWCILTYQGPLIPAEQNQLLTLVTVSRHITFTVI